MSPFGFAACQSKKCTNRAMLIYLLLRWCTSCSGKRQSRAETSAPSEVSRFCEFCAICGRTAVCLVCALETSAPPKIASVQSVGVTLLRRRQDTSATIFRTQRICVDLCNLWEALLSSRFCGFCAICGRTAACSVGALETSAPPKNASVQSVGGSPQQQVLC